MLCLNACARHGQVQSPRWIGRFSVKRGHSVPKRSLFNAHLYDGHSVHAPPAQTFFASLLLFFSLFFVSVPFSFADNQNVIISPTTEAAWDEAIAQEFIMTLQISVPISMYSRDTNIFSAIWELLPTEFGDFKLNTIGRRPHITVMYLDKKRIDTILRVIRAFASMTPEVQARYNLFRRVKLFDPENIRIVQLGHKSKFGAVRPHAEAEALLDDLMRFIRDYMPDLAYDPLWHLSLIQWGEAVNLNYTDEQVKPRLEALGRLVQRAVNNVRARGGDPNFSFSLADFPMQLVMSPGSIAEEPLKIATFKATPEGRFAVSKVGVLRYNIGGDRSRTARVEFDMERFLAGERYPIRLAEPGVRQDYLPPRQYFAPMDTQEFAARLSPALREVYLGEVERMHISPTKYPALVYPGLVPMSGSTNPSHSSWVTSWTHRYLGPERTFADFDIIRKLKPPRAPDVITGTPIYASKNRRDMANPGDIDVLMNTMVIVPDSAKTYEEAKSYAIRRFIEHVIEYHNDLERNSEAAWMELRTVSDFSLGLAKDPEDRIEAAYTNNYLTGQQVRRDSSVADANGITQLMRDLDKKDFVKGKIDLFFGEDEGMDFSIQHNISFYWKAPDQLRPSVHFLHANAQKGIASDLRTGTYEDEDSIAVGLSVSRANTLWSIQKEPMQIAAIREIISNAFGHKSFSELPFLDVEPVFNAKFLKKYYNFLALLHDSGADYDQIFYEETMKLLRRRDPNFPNVTLKEMVADIQNAFNQPHLALTNELRRRVNDLREVNERRQTLKVKSWNWRRASIRRLLPMLEARLNSGQMVVPDEFRQKLAEFRRIFAKLDAMAPGAAVRELRKKVYYSSFFDLEYSLLRVFESANIKPLVQEKHLQFLHMMAANLPFMYMRYVQARTQDTLPQLQWTMRMMKIRGDAQHFQQLQLVSEHLHDLSFKSLAQLQRSLFEYRANDSGSNTQHCKDALSPVDGSDQDSDTFSASDPSDE